MEPEDDREAIYAFYTGLSGWVNWPFKVGLERRHVVQATETMWRRAADISPLAASGLAARSYQDGVRAVAPLNVNGIAGLTCGGLMPTAEAVLALVRGDDPTPFASALRPGERYVTHMRTTYSDDGAPLLMVVEVLQLSPPRPFAKVAELHHYCPVK